LIVRVALSLPIRQEFDFLLPPEVDPASAIGRRVRVRFSGRETLGVIVSAGGNRVGSGTLEPILAIEGLPAHSETSLRFCRRISDHYIAPAGLLLNRVLPRTASQRREESPRRLALARDLGETLAELETLARRAPKQAEILRQFLAMSPPFDERLLPFPRAALRVTVDRLIERGLLQVVPLPPRAPRAWPESFPSTGRVLFRAEERTETYAEMIESIVRSGRQALLLVPEILLAHRLASRLLEAPGLTGGRLYHGSLAEGARGAIWNAVMSGDAPWILGTRSALFLPFSRLGLIIVDEEQDPSHKQNDMLPYFHARDAALLLGEDSLVVLGTATPSVETVFRAEREAWGVVAHSREPRRLWHFVAPTSPRDPLPPLVIDQLHRALASGRRAVVGIPRRGYFQAVLCKQCHRPLRCQHCGTNLSVAERGGRATCLLCGTSSAHPRCLHCGSEEVLFVGWGSLRVEEAVRALFPEASVLRVDAEAPVTHEIDLLESGADVVIGTPMLAKGPSLDRVGLVVALDVDRRFAFPDFRARERAFQYLRGLSGLASSGHMVVVTTQTERQAFDDLAREDVDGFLQSELSDRENLAYPPFRYLARLALTRSDRARLRSDIESVRAFVAGYPVDLLGPAPSPRDPRVARFLLKALDRSALVSACTALAESDLPLQVDIDPERL
jgi:primosomal protein N' (replication factor Y)